MILFGTLFPFGFAWFSAKWLASKLQLWWGSIISVVIGYLLGVIMPTAIYAGIFEITELKFDNDFLMNIIANSLWISAIASI